MTEVFLYIFLSIIGASIGSFFNVCIHRIPIKGSLVKPGSACPVCKTPIRFYDNIPIISYMVLKGRCRECLNPIPIRYPIVEILTAAFLVLLYSRYGFSVEFLGRFILISALMLVSFIDLTHRIIPDRVSLPGIAVGFVFSVLRQGSWSDGVIFSAAGALLGGGVLFAIAAVYHLITGREGIGGGDMKLLSMIGAFTGWKGVVFTLFSASTIGAVVGVMLMIFSGRGARHAVPFGPFLSIAAVIYLFAGDALVSWYIAAIWQA